MKIISFSKNLFVSKYIFHNSPFFSLKVRQHPDRPAPAPPSTGPLTQLSPSSTDDMNATLLKSNGSTTKEAFKRELFGNFKGFSLKPLPMSKPNIAAASNVAYVHPVTKKSETTETKTEHCVPIRAAPLPPSNSPIKQQQKTSSPMSVPKQPSNSFRYENINTTAASSPETPIEVKLFATKSDARERPKISHPVLENSTCSVKELIGTANLKQQNLYENSKQKPINELPMSKPIGINSQLKKLPMEKGSMKNLEISAPIKTVTFGRSQSMRSPTAENPQIKKSNLSSGSMRKAPNVKRQMSIVDRPKNPPPPRPVNLPPSLPKLPQEQFYANIGTCSNGKSQESLSNSTDNLYCVIEDLKRPVNTSPANGLLSEIVNEIENRNIASIYSTTKSKPSTTSKTDEQTNLNSIQNNRQSGDNPSEVKSGTNTMLDETGEQRDSTAKKSGTPHNSNIVGTSAKKWNMNVVPGKPKPVIAAKPSVANSFEHKNPALNQTSQKDSTKKPVAGKSTWNNKPKINPTSGVRALHKRFEN